MQVPPVQLVQVGQVAWHAAIQPVPGGSPPPVPPHLHAMAEMRLNSGPGPNDTLLIAMVAGVGAL